VASSSRITPLNLAIAAEFKKRREEMGLTQQELAKLAGTSQSEISLLETADRTRLTPTFIKVCYSLGCKVSELIAVAEQCLEENAK